MASVTFCTPSSRPITRFVEFFVQMKDLGPLAFGQFGNGNAGPAGDDTGNLILGDAFRVPRRDLHFLTFFFLDGKLLLEFGQFAVLELCSLVQVVVLFCLLDLFVHVFDLLTEFGEIFDRMLFIVPLGFLCIEFIPELCQLFLKVSETLAA